MFAELFGVDAGFVHGAFQAAVTGNHFTLLLGEVAHLLLGLLHGPGHVLGRLFYLGELLGHLLGITLGLVKLGAGGANLASQGAISVNLAALFFQIANFGFGVGEVFGGDAALAGDGLEGGGEFVHRPEQDL
ncbi:hypothetical protein [Aeromonas caviae]|uniref:hypothetical protein n=1 Tax=Aeromonas caviae TaxID=648 RepID=UPI001CC4BD87|nr:hypothetical protein [Aeromonas caviae]